MQTNRKEKQVRAVNSNLFKEMLRTQSIQLMLLTGILCTVIAIIALQATAGLRNQFDRFIEQEVVMIQGVERMYALGLQRGQAVRNVVIDPTDSQARNNYQNAAEQFSNLYSSLEAQFMAAGLAGELRQLSELDRQVTAAQQNILALAGKPGALAAIAADETPRWRSEKEVLFALQAALELQEQQAQKAMQAYAGRVQLWIGGLLAFSLVLFVMNQISLRRSLLLPIEQINQALAVAESGDLTSSAAVTTKGVVQGIAASLNATIGQFRQLVLDSQQNLQRLIGRSQELTNSAQEIAVGALGINQATEEVARGATQQAVDVGNMLEEMARFDAQLEGIGGSFGQLDQAAVAMQTQAVAGQADLARLYQSSQQIESVFSSIQTSMQRLSGSVSEVGQVAGTIDQIAEQTNLLALNASIEAARAGASGAGFAVVAAEVRKLAEQSLSSAGRIQQLIDNITADTLSFEQTVSQSSRELVKQQQSIDSGAAALGEIVNGVQLLLPLINQSVQLFSGTAESRGRLVQGIESLAAVSQQTSAATEQISATAFTQSDLVEQVRQLVEQVQAVAGQVEASLARFRTN